MSFAKKFYGTLVEVLQEIREITPGTSQLQTDKAIARRFGVSESTARNWRRGTNAQVSSSVISAVLRICQQVAPGHVPHLQFLANLSRGVAEVKMAAEMLVDELAEHVLTPRTTWHIYSGPLKMAHDTNLPVTYKRQLLMRAGLVTERILEIGIDRANIPCVGELVRYSTHGWFVKGFIRTRLSSLSDEHIGIMSDSVSNIEKALYLGDGCANAALYTGDFDGALRYSSMALRLLDATDRAEEAYAGVSLRDARMMVRTMQAMSICYLGDYRQQTILDQYMKDYLRHEAELGWIEGQRHEALALIELTRQADYGAAAYHFEMATMHLDRWLSQFGIPFSSTPAQSLAGYALLKVQGPDDHIKSLILEGLLRTTDQGFVVCQIQARMCNSALYTALGDMTRAQFHHRKAQELVESLNFGWWYNGLSRLLTPQAAHRMS